MEPIRTFHGFAQNPGERRMSHLNVQPGMGGEPNVPANELGQVPPELRKYFNRRDPYHQPMDPTKPGRMLFDRESYEKDQALDRYEQRAEQFNARVMNAKTGLAGLNANIVAKADRVSAANRQAYMDLRSDLYQRFNGVIRVLQQDLNMERQNDVYMSRSDRPQWEMQNGRAVKRVNRFVYVAELDKVLEEFAGKVINQDKLIRDTANGKKEATVVAEKEYRKYSDKVFDNAEVIAAKKRVEEGEAAVLKSKKAGALKELPQIKKDNDVAKAKSETAKENLSKAARAATAAEKAVKTAKEKVSNSGKLNAEIAVLEGKVATLKGEIAKLRADLPTVETEVGDAKTKIDRDSVRMKEKMKIDANADVARINALVPPPADKAQQIKRIQDKLKADTEDLLDKTTKDKKTEDAKVTAHKARITDKVKEHDADTIALNKKKAEVAALHAADPAAIKKLEAKAETAKRSVAAKKTEVTKAEKEAAATQKKYEAAQVPIEEAEKSLKKEKANLAEQIKLARTAISGEKREYRDVAMDTVAAINDEGSHLWQNLRENKEDVSRMAELMQKKTDIFAEIVQNGESTSVDYRQLFASIRTEHRFLRSNKLVAANGERLGKLLELEKTYGPKYLDALAKQTQILYDDPKATLDDQFKAVQQEIMALQEFPELGAAKRMDGLRTMMNLRIALNFTPLKNKTNEAIQRSTDMDVSKEVLQQAIDAINAEGTFLKRYGDRENRFAYLRETRQKLTAQLTAQHGKEYYREANERTAGAKNRAGRIETVQQLIESGATESGKRATGEWKAHVEELKQEQLRGLATETDREAIAAINNPDRRAKQQGIKVILDEVNLLHTHFYGQSNERVAQLRTGVETLLKQIAGETTEAVDVGWSLAGAKDFEKAFGLIASERTMYQSTRALQFVQPQRTAAIAEQETKMDIALIHSLNAAHGVANRTEASADWGAAQALLTVLEKRLPFIADEQKIPALARAEEMRAILGKNRMVSAKREGEEKQKRDEAEGMSRAENQIEVQGRIDTTKEHMKALPFDHPEVAAEAGYSPKQLEAQLKADKEQLQQSLDLASKAQQKTIKGLIAEIDAAIPERLRTQVENKNTFKRNFNLMVGEIRSVIDGATPITGPTLKKYQDRIKATQETIAKAQGYIDVAADYEIPNEQIQKLQELMTDLQGNMKKDQDIVATFNRNKKKSA